MALRTPSSPPHTSFQCFPVFPVQHRWAVPLPPTLSGRGGASGSFWGQSPRARSLDPSAPSSVCFPAGLPGAARPLGCPWTWPGQHQHPGLCKAGLGTVTTPAQGCQWGWRPQGLEQPLQGTRAVPLCQPCTVRGTRSVLPLKGTSTGLCQLPQPRGFGVCPITVLWVSAVPGESQLRARGWEPGSGAREEEDEGSSCPGEVLATGPLLAPLTPPAQGAK